MCQTCLLARHVAVSACVMISLQQETEVCRLRTALYTQIISDSDPQEFEDTHNSYVQSPMTLSTPTFPDIDSDAYFKRFKVHHTRGNNMKLNTYPSLTQPSTLRWTVK